MYIRTVTEIKIRIHLHNTGLNMGRQRRPGSHLTWQHPRQHALHLIPPQLAQTRRAAGTVGGAVSAARLLKHPPQPLVVPNRLLAQPKPAVKSSHVSLDGVLFHVNRLVVQKPYQLSTMVIDFRFVWG